jgi:hypothetical protein
MLSPQSSGTRTPSCRPSKIDRLRQTLVDLLPSQQDADYICSEGNCWLLVQALSGERAEVIDSYATSSTLRSPAFDLVEISKQHPLKIATTLMYLAVCEWPFFLNPNSCKLGSLTRRFVSVGLQQLTPGAQTSMVHFSTSVETRIDRINSTIQALITSDDDMISSVDGLRCIMLQGIFHINSGNPRRAWLIFRRAVNVGQLLGLHKSDSPLPKGREIWFRVVHSDRYLVSIHSAFRPALTCTFTNMLY